MTNRITDAGLLRLLQLSSAALPVGGYSFSQGLEYAVEEGWLKQEQDVVQWLSLQLNESLARVDLPLLNRQCDTVRRGDETGFSYWNDYVLACRETDELRLTDVAMGHALIKLLDDLAVPTVLTRGLGEISFVSAYALAAEYWRIDPRVAGHGFCWSWLENQVAAATKLVPLGQTSAQRLLGELQRLIPVAVDFGGAVQDNALGASLPALAMASAWHETQYSRLFRS